MSEPALLSALVLAAGRSQRMGRAKMTLPWGERTVIGQVVFTLQQAGVPEILVVTGGASQQVEKALSRQPVRFVHNPAFAEGEMLSSVQAGLAAMPPEIQAALVVLGDQPQIKVEILQDLMEVYSRRKSLLVVPSHQNRRGHPWIIDRRLWGEVLGLKPPSTLRDILMKYAAEIEYLLVPDASILEDLDSPADYERYKPDL